MAITHEPGDRNKIIPKKKKKKKEEAAKKPAAKKVAKKKAVKKREPDPVLKQLADTFISVAKKSLESNIERSQSGYSNGMNAVDYDILPSALPNEYGRNPGIASIGFTSGADLPGQMPSVDAGGYISGGGYGGPGFSAGSGGDIVSAQLNMEEIRRRLGF